MADLIAKVAKHGVTPEEMRAAIFAMERVKTKGEEPNAAYRDELAIALEEGKYSPEEIESRVSDHIKVSEMTKKEDANVRKKKN